MHRPVAGSAGSWTDAPLSDNLVADTPNPESQVLEREMLALLQSIVEALPATYREVYVLRYRHARMS